MASERDSREAAQEKSKGELSLTTPLPFSEQSFQPEPHLMDQAAFSNLTAQTLYSGILAIGSSAVLVSTLAAFSAK
jgi:hypothetical protein